MSPLAPQTQKMAVKLDEQNADNDSIDQLVSPAATDQEKIVYSVTDLHYMRHDRNEPPNSSAPRILLRIKKVDEMDPSIMNNQGANSFSNNIMSSIMEQLKVARQRYGRPADRWEREQNGGRAHNGAQRQINRGPPIRLNLRSEVKLREAENAWKPTFLKKADNDDTNELYKQVRAILNKLTSANFNVLSAQFKKLEINTLEKLTEVISLVFNKAVDEPHFSIGYAHLCEYLSHCSQDIGSNDVGTTTFKRTLITKCQIEFEKNVANRLATEESLSPLKEKLAEFKKNGDLNGAKEMQSQIEETESVLRRRLVSTVRFIGELYKLEMLTTNIMNVCITKLIQEAAPNQANMNQVNEKLECLCKLLTTVGAKLESTSPEHGYKPGKRLLDLTEHMRKLKRIADNDIRNFKTNTRIRFMIMDVIELRNNKWVPKITNEQQQLSRFY